MSEIRVNLSDVENGKLDKTEKSVDTEKETHYDDTENVDDYLLELNEAAPPVWTVLEHTINSVTALLTPLMLCFFFPASETAQLTPIYVAVFMVTPIICIGECLIACNKIPLEEFQHSITGRTLQTHFLIGITIISFPVTRNLWIVCLIAIINVFAIGYTWQNTDNVRDKNRCRKVVIATTIVTTFGFLAADTADTAFALAFTSLFFGLLINAIQGVRNKRERPRKNVCSLFFTPSVYVCGALYVIAAAMQVAKLAGKETPHLPHTIEELYNLEKNIFPFSNPFLVHQGSILGGGTLLLPHNHSEMPANWTN